MGIAHLTMEIAMTIRTVAAIIALVPLAIVRKDPVAGWANLVALMKSLIVVLGFIVMARLRLVKNQLKSNKVDRGGLFDR